MKNMIIQKESSLFVDVDDKKNLSGAVQQSIDDYKNDNEPNV